MDCHNPGETNADIAGLGVILAFVIQGGFTIVLSMWTAMIDFLQRRESQNDEYQFHIFAWFFNDMPISELGPAPRGLQVYNWLGGSRELRVHKRTIYQLLGVISDTQVLTGIALLVAAFAQHEDLSFYHFHIIYDTTSLVGVSACAALANALGNKSRQWDRYAPLAVFLALYIAFVVVYNIRLATWDPTVPGRCYHHSLLAAPSSSHPVADYVYLAVTAFYCFFSIISCRAIANSEEVRRYYNSGPLDMPTEMRKRVESSDRRKFWILALALGQYPLHTYMLFALRASNQRYLEGDSENEWGFGQVMAMVLVGPFLLECVRGVKDFKDELQKQIERENESLSLRPSTSIGTLTTQSSRHSAGSETLDTGGLVNNTPPSESIHSEHSDITEDDGIRVLHRRRVPWQQQVKHLLGKFLWYPGTLRG